MMNLNVYVRKDGHYARVGNTTAMLPRAFDEAEKLVEELGYETLGVALSEHPILGEAIVVDVKEAGV